MIKKLILLVVGIMMAALFAGCGNDTPKAQKEQAGKKIQVVTSLMQWLSLQRLLVVTR